MLKNYLKTAFKVFLRRKFFTFVSLFGICFTLVVLMVVAAALDNELGAYPPETRADRTLRVSYAKLVRSEEQGRDFRTRYSNNAGYEFADRYLRKLETPERVAVFSEGGRVISYQGTDKVYLFLRHLDGVCWEVLDFEFLEGRPFTAQEDAAGAPLAVINQATRERFFGEGPALGQTLETSSQRYRVIGVVKNVSEARSVFADVWVPLGTVLWERQGAAGLVGNLEVLLLARAREDLPRIKAEFKTMLSRVDLSGAAPYDRFFAEAETPLETMARSVSGHADEEYSSRAAQVRLFVVVGIGALLFMSLPALNLVNLNLSRILERASEVGVRKAFGASSGSLVGQFLVESLLLTLVGGMMGFALSGLVLSSFSWWGWARYLEFHFSYRVFGAGLVMVVVFGVLSGVYPAWRMSRLHPVEALRGGAR